MYKKDAMTSAIQRVQEEAETVGLAAHEAVLRWMLHHSKLESDCGDGIIIGASSFKQLEGTLKACASGPLPQEFVKLFEDVWASARAHAPPYAAF